MTDDHSEAISTHAEKFRPGYRNIATVIGALTAAGATITAVETEASTGVEGMCIDFEVEGYVPLYGSLDESDAPADAPPDSDAADGSEDGSWSVGE